MNTSRWLTLVGGLLLLVGLVTALAANHYQTRVMGQAGLGVAVWAPEKDSPEWKEKERLRTLANRWFWIGLVVTSIGVAAQTAGALWPNQ